MRRVADLTPGAARTDKRDAAVTAQAARTMPHTLRAVSISDEDTAALSMLTGPDLDPARQDRPDPAPPSRWSRGHDQPATPCWKSLPPDAAPTALRKAGKAHIGARLKKHGARRRAARASETVSVPEKQTVTVAGTDAAGTVLPHLARRLISLHSQRAEHRDRARGPGGGAPPSPAQSPPPVPGIGVPAAAVLLAETLGRTFDTGAQPASYAGLAPVTRRSGSPIRGERRLPRRQ